MKKRGGTMTEFEQNNLIRAARAVWGWVLAEDWRVAAVWLLLIYPFLVFLSYIMQ